MSKTNKPLPEKPVAMPPMNEVVLVITQDENDLLINALRSKKDNLHRAVCVSKSSPAYTQLVLDLSNMIHYLETGKRLEEPGA